jgi:hypothetical protein
MAAWAVLLITLLGVALGAVASFLSARLTDRNRWRREERLRWDTRRLECYTDFSAAIIRFHQHRRSAGSWAWHASSGRTWRFG